MTSNVRRPLVMVALDGQVKYVNDAFVESLGWSREILLDVAASSLVADIPKAVLLDTQKTVNWLRVSIRLGAARLDERLGWEEMAAAKRATRRCVSWREDFGMAQTNGITARCADGGTKISSGRSAVAVVAQVDHRISERL
ncbi:PAS domain-containing protein [Paraburkholderia nemoris]|uniref:PAS domain-containing protein n=1 Tax=Paraburkholderia nemoris TaxID=2793076 RepID=UPI001B15B0C0|nr:PAS domain-containing protein [Paraburkholderia nemoris]CAE6807159.1 hypothetical protein LMG22931_05693 [Paraburkholderia nemoris]